MTANQKFAYCMNVHPTANFDDVLRNLRGSASSIRRHLFTENSAGDVDRLGVGLWLSDPVAQEIAASADKLQILRDTLTECKLAAWTFNGFPQHNFHQTVVKHAVYEPTWSSPDRLRYTLQLIDLMASLSESSQTCSISTLPIGWPHAGVKNDE